MGEKIKILKAGGEVPAEPKATEPEKPAVNPVDDWRVKFLANPEFTMNLLVQAVMDLQSRLDRLEAHDHASGKVVLPMGQWNGFNLNVHPLVSQIMAGGVK